jgi:hypothetical protein
MPWVTWKETSADGRTNGYGETKTMKPLLPNEVSHGIVVVKIGNAGHNGL